MITAGRCRLASSAGCVAKVRGFAIAVNGDQTQTNGEVYQLKDALSMIQDSALRTRKRNF